MKVVQCSVGLPFVDSLNVEVVVHVMVAISGIWYFCTQEKIRYFL
jgi:hypothetical protein